MSETLTETSCSINYDSEAANKKLIKKTLNKVKWIEINTEKLC